MRIAPTLSLSECTHDSPSLAAFNNDHNVSGFYITTVPPFSLLAYTIVVLLILPSNNLLV